MIIYKNNSRKLKKAFSIAEIVVSIFILGFIGLSLFQIYNVIQEENENLNNKIISIYFSKYISQILRKSEIPENLNIINSPFYIKEEGNEEISFSPDPVLLNSNGGFQKNLNSKNNSFSQEIFFLEKNTLNNIIYYQYKINTSLNGNKNTVYITK